MTKLIFAFRNFVNAPKNVSRVGGGGIYLHVLQLFERAECSFILFMYIIFGLH